MRLGADMLAPTLISAGASILGGLLGKSDPVSAGQNAYSHVKGIMRAAKDFNWNPLYLMGSVPPVGGTPGDNSSISSGIANAGMLIADKMQSRSGVAGLLNKYQQANVKLARENETLKLRPPVPGIYSNAVSDTSGGSVGSVQGARGGSGVGVERPPLDPLALDYFTEQNYSNDGQTTAVPVGPDGDSIITGWLIRQYNRHKAFVAQKAVDAARMDFGQPLSLWERGQGVYGQPVWRKADFRAPKRKYKPPLLRASSVPFIPNPSGYGYGRP